MDMDLEIYLNIFVEILIDKYFVNNLYCCFDLYHYFYIGRYSKNSRFEYIYYCHCLYKKNHFYFHFYFLENYRVYYGSFVQRIAEEFFISDFYIFDILHHVVFDNNLKYHDCFYDNKNNIVCKLVYFCYLGLLFE